MDNQEKRCENCKYFVCYYSVYKSEFVPLPHGHCLKQHLTPKQQRSFPFINGCEMWVTREELKKQREESILSALNSISDRLDQIRRILMPEQTDFTDD